MDKIRINQEGEFYEIEDIRRQSEHVLRITFSSTIPMTFGDITVYTAGGEFCASFAGYDTVYRDEGQRVYLSDDGSIYKAPDPASPPEEIVPPAPYIPTAEELLLSAQATKRREVSAACEQIIYNGVSVALSDGSVEHYSLTEHDQINLFGKQAQLATGAEQLEYHADGQPCRYYSAADMQRIIQSAMFHVSYHTTYCNALNMWINGSQDVEEVKNIFYGADVPEEYQSEVLRAYLLQIAAMAEDNGSEAVS